MILTHWGGVPLPWFPFLILMPFSVFLRALEDATVDDVASPSQGPTGVLLRPPRAVGASRPVLPVLASHIPQLVRLWASHAGHGSKGRVCAESPHHASGTPGMRGRDTSGGMLSIPRPSGRLTPCAPGLLPVPPVVREQATQAGGKQEPRSRCGNSNQWC
jgi:hypothetical protein